MTPDPTLVDPAPPDENVEPPPASPWNDRAASVAFGGQSSTAASEPETDNGSLTLLLGFVGVILAIGFLRSWWFPGILAGLLFMLFMHELGHYVTARASGMKVTEFFLGFGPKIWSFNRGETEYGVKGIPAGAYVRIIGMTNLDEIDPAEEHRTYRAQPYWQRMMTICAGSAMHFLMAIVAIVILFTSFGYQGFNGPPWFVDVVVPGSTASSLGIQQGDQIRSINGESFANWDEFGDLIGGLQDGVVQIEVARDGETRTLAGELGLRPEDVLLDGFGLNLIIEDSSIGLEAGYIWPQDQADQLGIEVGDAIWRVEDVDNPSETELAEILRDRTGEVLEVEVLRGGEVVELSGVAEADQRVGSILADFGAEEGDVLLRVADLPHPTEDDLTELVRARAGDTITVSVLRDAERVVLTGRVELNTSTPFRGFFGVGPRFVPQAEPGTADAFAMAVEDFGVIAATNVRGIADLINPADWFGFEDPEPERRAALLPRQGSGAPLPQSEDQDTNRPLSVVGIGRLIAESDAVDQVLFLFAVVNIFIGLFNLVPLLPLDGGHAAIASYERARELVTRKPHRVDAAKLIPITWVVIMLLVGVGVWTVTLDIFSWPT